MIIYLLILVILLSVPVLACATTEIQPRFTYIIGFSSGLNIDTSTGTATCSGSIQLREQFPVKLIFDMQKKIDDQWLTFKRWTATGTGVIQFNDSIAITAGYNYRLVVSAYVYDTDNNQIENAKMSKESSYP